ncbi:ATPase-AAA-core domain-containing protein [Aphelenchoides fujianensis]|nr:ATPase-AAA-core domain-containing protein [Aphelenchoides fujianensis]
MFQAPRTAKPRVFRIFNQDGSFLKKGSIIDFCVVDFKTLFVRSHEQGFVYLDKLVLQTDKGVFERIRFCARQFFRELETVYVFTEITIGGVGQSMQRVQSIDHFHSVQTMYLLGYERHSSSFVRLFRCDLSAKRWDTIFVDTNYLSFVDPIGTVKCGQEKELLTVKMLGGRVKMVSVCCRPDRLEHIACLVIEHDGDLKAFMVPLDEADIQVLKKYGQSPYSEQIKQLETEIESCLKRVNELCGVKESGTGLAPPALWDIVVDKQAMQQEKPLQVARCTKIITSDQHAPRYLINVKQFAKYIVDLADSVVPTDIEEGMRVGVDLETHQINLPLPIKIDPTVTMMRLEEKPDVTYADVGGCKEQIEKLREIVETPLLHPDRYVNLGIEPP